MSPTSKREYIQITRLRYAQASKRGKSQIPGCWAGIATTLPTPAPR